MGDSGGSILGSSGLLGCPFMPDLIFSIYIFAYKWALEAMFCWFEASETCPVRGGFGWFNPGVEWASGMPVHVRFTAQHIYLTSLKSAVGNAAGAFVFEF